MTLEEERDAWKAIVSNLENRITNIKYWIDHGKSEHASRACNEAKAASYKMRQHSNYRTGRNSD